MAERSDGERRQGSYGESFRDEAEPWGDPPNRSADDERVLTLVCFTCGNEYYFTSTEPPPDLSCEKCGNTVFRSFLSRDDESEAAADFADSTERNLRPDDAEGETLPGDVLDLDNG